jgi:BirA family biotin operon repressor/biotin-[acetyl-CoA-carboxylase] ligase
MSEPLPEDLRSALERSAERRGCFGEPAVFFTETGSTNDVAAALAERGAAEGTTVIALSQTAGRGRLGRRWFSPPGSGLYVSIVCRDRRAAPMLTLAGGVAVADGIRHATGLPVAIKWPNDVVCVDRWAPARRRKLAGVLAEGCTGPGGLQHVVVGLGVNLRPAAYPPDIAGRATSIEAELGRQVDAGPILAEILATLNQHATAAAQGNVSALLNRWRELAPSASGARVEFTSDGVVRRGVTSGIDDVGALLVKVDGKMERIIAGEMTWL